MLQMLPGPIPSGFLIKSLFKSMRNALAAPCANSFTFLHYLLTEHGKCSWSFLRKLLQVVLNPDWYLWKMLLELMGPVLLHFFIKSLWNKWKMLQMLPGPIPSGFLIKSWLKINGQCSWSSLEQVLYISLSYPYWKSMQHVLAASWVNSSSLLYEIIVKTYGSCSKCFLGQFHQDSLLNHH